MPSVASRPKLPLVHLLESRDLRIALQPIFAANGGSVHGYEALCRLPERLQPAGPMDLLEAASVAGLARELDLLLVDLAISRFGELALTGHLFINLLPQTLVESRPLLELIAQSAASAGVRTSDLVIEITEHGLNLDPHVLRASVDGLRELGCEVAIDDLGAGASGLKIWSVLRPDYVKLDRYFIAQLEQDAVGAEVLRSLLDIAHVMGSRVVAEGIETQEQYRILRTLGVDYLQGYYLSRPALDPEDHPDHITTIVQEKATENSAAALLVERPSIPPETRVADVVLLFRQHADWDSLAIVAGGRPIGIVRRDELLTLLSKPLYPEVYNRKPVTRVMDAAPIVVDARARLEQVSRLVTANGAARINEDFIIARHGRYAGVGRTIALLQQITAAQVEAAAQSNPLTALPGNREIDAQLFRMIALRVPFVACHVDIDHFKAYNDEYGYRAGDQVLLALADLLKASASGRTDFVGHIGGDDFILIMRRPDWREWLARVFDAFGATIDKFYNDEHRRGGGIRGVDRQGREQRFALMTLSMGAVSCTLGRYAAPSEIGEGLRKVKALAKASQGHACFHDTDGAVYELQIGGGAGRWLACDRALAR